MMTPGSRRASSVIDVPFTNNERERHLGCAKGKLEQSGGFRSTDRGQVPYCDFLTVAKMTRLCAMSPYGMVSKVFSG